MYPVESRNHRFDITLDSIDLGKSKKQTCMINVLALAEVVVVITYKQAALRHNRREFPFHYEIRHAPD